MMMKKKILIFAIVASIFNTSCIATRSSVQINKVEIGMSKADIKKLLGTPEFKKRRYRRRAMGISQDDR